jgi:hypothetical protein
LGSLHACGAPVPLTSNVSRTTMKAIRIKSHEVFEKLLTSIGSDTVTATIHWRLHQKLWAARTEWTTEMEQSLTF